MKKMIAALALTAALISTPVLAKAPASYLLAARNDRAPDTAPSYVYAGRHKSVATFATKRACMAAGNAMTEDNEHLATSATRFACVRSKRAAGLRFAAADLFGLAR